MDKKKKRESIYKILFYQEFGFSQILQFAWNGFLDSLWTFILDDNACSTYISTKYFLKTFTLYFHHTGKVCYIDYEYASYNYQAFDLGNHFDEMAGKLLPWRNSSLNI